MYAGRIVETGPAPEIYGSPAHPYTKRLLDCVPVFGKVREKLNMIPGTVPDLSNLPQGCKFCPRCWKVKDKCKQQEPELEEVRPGHKVRCFYPE